MVPRQYPPHYWTTSSLKPVMPHNMDLCCPVVSDPDIWMLQQKFMLSEWAAYFQSSVWTVAAVFCSKLTGEPHNVNFCCCSPLASKFNIVQRHSSTCRGSNRWLLLPQCPLKAVWPFPSDLWHQQHTFTQRTVTQVFFFRPTSQRWLCGKIQ